MKLEIEPLQNMGASVRGLDITREFTLEQEQTLREAWWKYGLLLFPDRTEDDYESLIRLSHVFGEDEPHTLPELIIKDQPNLIVIRYDAEYKTPEYSIDGEPLEGWLFWHQDEAYTTNIPMGSAARMTTVTETGGDTGFLDIARAYDDLPETLKQRIENLNVLHSLVQGSKVSSDRFGMGNLDIRPTDPKEYEEGEGAIPAADGSRFEVIESPLVVTHPYTGRKTMLLSPFGLIGATGIEKEEGDEILHELCDHVIQEKYQYRHKWKKNDITVWDNWTTMHMGFGYPPGQVRAGVRTTIKGPNDDRTGHVYKEVV